MGKDDYSSPSKIRCKSFGSSNRRESAPVGPCNKNETQNRKRMKQKWKNRSGRSAFTLIELLVVIAIIAILASMLLPALARAKDSGQRITCVNDLRTLGLAMQMYEDEHDGLQPVRTINGVAGGSWPTALRDYYQELKVLACPSDTGRVAEDFSATPNGGYLNPNYRNAATSYFLTHAWYNGQFAMLAGDRNLGNDVPETCSRFVAVTGAGSPPLNASLAWGTNLHNGAGNVVRIDGRVNEYSTEEIRDAVTTDPIVDRDALRALHLIKPR